MKTFEEIPKTAKWDGNSKNNNNNVSLQLHNMNLLHKILDFGTTIAMF
jgi:hypothetical protein